MTVRNPCAFCGYIGSMSWLVGHMDPKPWHIECNNCGACGPWAETEEDANEAWNRRSKI